MPAKKVSSASKGSDTDTRLMASGFITAMKAPSSTKEQKEALKFYQDLPRFSDIKKDILQRWKQDRSCTWFQSFKEIHVKKVEQTDERTQGNGTVFEPSSFSDHML